MSLDPYQPAENGGETIARVKKKPRTARVRMRLKGQKDGPVYQGQKVVRACKSCGK